MRKLAILAVLVGTFPLSVTASAQSAVSSPTSTVQPQERKAAQPSPAEQRIAAAKQQLAKDPKHTEAYIDLALSYLRRARETADPAWCQQAQAAVTEGLRLAPGDLQLEKAAIALLLARQQWAEALARATELNRKNMDDVTIYGYMAEADLALGKYADADTAAQWMLNMRPNNIPGLLLGADLRVIYGDAPGALEFLNQAFGETPQVEPEELASIANRIAVIELESGHADRAGQALARADALFPGYPVTLETLARVHMAQQKPDQAIALLEQRLAQQSAAHAPDARTLFLLALAKRQAGQKESGFPAFAKSAIAQENTPANDDVDLILYDAGLPGQAPVDVREALRLAEKQVATRQDVATLDAYAWALYAGGQYAEADAQIQKALAVGVRSAQLEEHAGEIALKLDKPAAAARLFATSLEADPASPYAELAAKKIGTQANVAAAASPGTAVPLPAGAPEMKQPAPAAPALTPAVSLNLLVDKGELPAGLLIPKPTGTERIIKKVQAQVSARPQDAASYAALGAAFFQRARETGDVEDYSLAEQALTKSLDLVSTDLSATAPLETMAEVCMGEHRFADALDYAQKALALGSGDVSAFATVGDAYADMGEYEKAGIAYARLQPAPGAAADPREAYAEQTRNAYLTFVSGDSAGAIVQMRVAISEGVIAHLPSENLAWLYYELGEFSYQAGSIQAAADAYLTALNVYPGNYRALAGLARIRANQGKYAQAITLYQSAIAVVPMPIYIAELGDVYEKTGQPAEAEKQYKLVEYIGKLGHINQVLHNRDLALFYADHGRHLQDSLTLAHKEFEVRSDIYTWDALAWSLYANGRYQEADEAMRHALRLGTKDAMLLFHAGMIAARLGQPSRATSQLEAALAINAHFHPRYADLALHELAELHAQSPQTAEAAQSTPRDFHAR